MWPALLSSGARAWLLLALGAAGTAALVAGVVLGRTNVIAVGVLLLGVGYAAHLVVDHPPLEARAALFATGLLLVAELGCWSVELRRAVSTEPGRHLRRLIAEIALCLGSLVLSALVLAVADAGLPRGIAVELAGAAAAAALGWLAFVSLRRSP